MQPSVGYYLQYLIHDYICKYACITSTKANLMFRHNRKGLQPFVDNYEKKKTSVASFYREKH